MSASRIFFGQQEPKRAPRAFFQNLSTYWHSIEIIANWIATMISKGIYQMIRGYLVDT